MSRPPARAIPELSPELRLKFQQRVSKGGSCWNWTGATRLGYGQFYFRRRCAYLAHRVALVVAGHDLDPALTVDHLCGNKLCVNPAHLEQVPAEVNSARYYAQRMRPERCARGHLLAETGRWARGKKEHPDRLRLICRACNAENMRRWRASRQQQAES